MTVSALIMAGGEGRRMGGKDKGLMMCQGKAFVDHVIDALRPQVDNIAISANRNIEEYAQRTPHVFADARQWQGLGPLAALGTAASDIQFAKADWLLIVPCDTLRLPPDLVERFLQTAGKSFSTHAFYAETPMKQHYSVMFVRPQTLQSTPAYLQTGLRTMRGWLEQEHALPVTFPLEEAFVNYNSPQDMAAVPC
ncbi:molybdenum cofactor guanylyltransferase [Neisseria sp. Dent CA1/247]|uniref:Molybdenum cofactor guanylyltransferase n=1 Tax=Neisseria zoodegmatis TaxID=326523 RepID=A0A378WE54_9NEIS|nr:MULTISPECIES: molybdenum cofactor guanylyltransferase MobA [Neisseria]UOO76099.1 molybdenum cofactor guanylyltransferase [Neisseria sp. Dent CA1/247]SUA35738.1 putative molybdopterin-guanine dinucleotide biosynthesis protein A [Neisseria zoodegmatis]